MPSFVATALVTAIALAPAAGRASAKTYPAPAILSEFGTACLSNREVDVTTEATFENWRGAALKQGWSTIRQAPPPGTDFATRAAFRAYHSIMALDYDLLSYLLATGDEQIEREVMIKTVGGRAVYLSLLVLGRGDTPILSQCRLFDPLGDGISTLPIGRAEIDSWADNA